MTTAIDTRNADDVITLLDDASAALREHESRRGSSVHLPAHGRLLITGDLHDNPIHLQKIIDLAHLDRGADQHVVLHELIHGDRLLNGMDFSYRVIIKVAQLILTYPGQVHPMLANHELSQMTGRAVGKGAGNSVEQFNDAVDYTFSDDADSVRDALNRFFASMPLAVRSESGIFCSHSLPNAMFMKYFDQDILDRDLEPDDLQPPHGSAYLMTWGRQYDHESVAALADAWGVRVFCLGHQKVETGVEAWSDQVILLNSDHEHGAVLPADLASPPVPNEVIMHAIPLASVGEPL
ncbi:MAG: metallophosphoesterase [Planctomycetota bacterium]